MRYHKSFDSMTEVLYYWFILSRRFFMQRLRVFLCKMALLVIGMSFSCTSIVSALNEYSLCGKITKIIRERSVHEKAEIRKNNHKMLTLTESQKSRIINEIFYFIFTQLTGTDDVPNKEAQARRIFRELTRITALFRRHKIDSNDLRALSDEMRGINAANFKDNVYDLTVTDHVYDFCDNILGVSLDLGFEYMAPNAPVKKKLPYCNDNDFEILLTSPLKL